MDEGEKSAQAVARTDPVNTTNPGSDVDGFETVNFEDVSNYERVILIIGKTGNGKSSMGNTLLGSKQFDVGRGKASETVEPTKSCVVPDTNCKLKVVDTPDLVNMGMTEDEKLQEVSRWKKETLPKLHVILLAVRCDVRYTAEEYATYCEVKRLWGNDTEFCKRLVVGFTFGDRLDGDINEELKSVCGELQTVLEDASNRYMVFNNKALNEDTQQNREKLFHKGNEVRIILIGKTGAGKSSLGNTIAGEKKFQPVVGMRSGTQKTDWVEIIRDGRIIQVTDTPGVCDTRRKSVEVYKEIAKSMTTASPGPHAILMVLRASERFTEEEGKAYDELKALFKGFTDYLIIVFTRIDELEEDEQDLESQLKVAPGKVGKIIKEAGGRYIGIKNKPSAERRKEGDKIMDIVYKMMAKNEGKYFSNKIFKAVAEMVDDEAITRHVTTDMIKRETVEETNPSFMEKIAKILKELFLKFVEACHIL